MWVSAGLK
jgi:hypothetical protein